VLLPTQAIFDIRCLVASCCFDGVIITSRVVMHVLLCRPVAFIIFFPVPLPPFCLIAYTSFSDIKDRKKKAETVKKVPHHPLSATRNNPFHSRRRI
jgi:hypothetical protein